MASRYAIKDLVQRVHANLTDASQRRRRRLRKHTFSIISNDCWGAEVYKDLGLPYDTPLIGTYVMGPCYMKLAADARTVLTSPLMFLEESQYPEVNRRRAQRWFPIGRLSNNVEIHFLHYASVEEAVQKWERRLARTHFDDLYFKLSGDKDLFTDDDFAIFDALPLAKIAFSAKLHPQLASVICIPDYTSDGKGLFPISLRYFDLVAWLNRGQP